MITTQLEPPLFMEGAAFRKIVLSLKGKGSLILILGWDQIRCRLPPSPFPISQKNNPDISTRQITGNLRAELSGKDISSPRSLALTRLVSR